MNDVEPEPAWTIAEVITLALHSVLSAAEQAICRCHVRCSHAMKARCMTHCGYTIEDNMHSKAQSFAVNGLHHLGRLQNKKVTRAFTCAPKGTSQGGPTAGNARWRGRPEYESKIGVNAMRNGDTNERGKYAGNWKHRR